MKTKQVPWFERISYGMTDMGYNLIFMMVSTYLMYFYTDIFGIPTAAIAPLFLLGRIVDGVTDPLEGILIDRANTRWGKCRPFWLWFSIPFAIFGIAAFLAPEFSLAGKIVYIYVTYIGLNLFTSLVSLPISAILPSLTSNTQERTVINVVRMIFSTVGTLIVTSTTLPLVNSIGQGDEQKGFLVVAIVFAVITTALFINGWAHTKERVVADGGKPVPVKKGLKSILNLPWFLLLGIVIIANLALTMKGQSTIYYMQYNLGRPDLTSALLTFPNLFMIVTIILSPVLSKKMGKRNASLLGIAITIAGAIIVIIFDTDIPLLFAGTILNYMGLGIPAGLLGAMFADTVDYTEWKAGVRSTGIIYSANSIGVKAGQGLGGALCAMVMTFGQYIPNVVQSDTSLFAIKFNFAWVILIGCVLLGVLFFFYKVDKLYPQIEADLGKKRQPQD